ncbi:protein adenylyltransferase Fic [Pseudoleptotrichia goodfellowii]|nr:Fic family protein [Pseudoleptotrichia goodfellowii]
MSKYDWKDNELKRMVSEKEEELLSKKRAKELYDKKIMENFEVGTFKGLQQIHEYLFKDIFEDAGKIREKNFSKGGVRFASAIFLKDNLKTLDKIPESTFENIIDKYVEMNILHPFNEGNGRSMRIWFDRMFIKNLGICIDWSKINPAEYLQAMEQSPVNTLELRTLLEKNITKDIDNREIYMHGINQSYKYENMYEYDIEKI